MTKRKAIFSYVATALLFISLIFLLLSVDLYYLFTYLKSYVGMKYLYLLPAIIIFIAYLLLNFAVQMKTINLYSSITKIISLALSVTALSIWFNTQYFGYYNFATILLLFACMVDIIYCLTFNYKSTLNAIKNKNIAVITTFVMFLTALITSILLFKEAENIIFDNWNLISTISIASLIITYILLNLNYVKRALNK